MASVEWSRVVDVVMYRAETIGVAMYARGGRRRERAIGRIMAVRYAEFYQRANGQTLNRKIPSDLYTKRTARHRTTKTAMSPSHMHLPPSISIFLY
jgi:hypothetical protein